MLRCPAAATAAALGERDPYLPGALGAGAVAVARVSLKRPAAARLK